MRSDAPWANSTRPVPGSMTSAPACLPSTPEPSTLDSAAETPRLAGTGAEDPAPASTWLAAAAGRVATRGMFHSARRPGIMAATATPAPSVNTLIMASAITMVARSRFTGERFTRPDGTGSPALALGTGRPALAHWPARPALAGSPLAGSPTPIPSRDA